MILLIGDIQGCCDAFERLLQHCSFSPSRDRLVALGDLVNRGPASLRVLQRLRALEGSARCLLGNHDLHLLATAHGVRRPHRHQTRRRCRPTDTALPSSPMSAPPSTPSTASDGSK